MAALDIAASLARVAGRAVHNVFYGRQGRRARREERVIIPSRRLDESTTEYTMTRPIRARIGRGKSFKPGREGGRRGRGGMWVRRNIRKVKEVARDWMRWRTNDAKMDWEDRMHK